MKKDASLKYSEINRLLLELRELIPDMEFGYSDKTGLLEKIIFNFQEDTAPDLNFFVSLPRSYPSLNLLKKTHPHSMTKPLKDQGHQSKKGVLLEQETFPELRGTQGVGGKNINR